LQSASERQRAHPDLNQGPANLLQSAALTTELCTLIKKKAPPCPNLPKITHNSQQRSALVYHAPDNTFLQKMVQEECAFAGKQASRARLGMGVLRFCLARVSGRAFVNLNAVNCPGWPGAGETGLAEFGRRQRPTFAIRAAPLSLASRLAREGQMEFSKHRRATPLRRAALLQKCTGKSKCAFNA
jgi:hypothetical protein